MILIRADKDWEIHSADYSQIELRIIAWLAPEPRMAKLYQEGADLHRATAAYLKSYAKQRWTVQEFWPKRRKLMAAVSAQDRQNAKGINFGFNFGMQAPTFVAYASANYGVNFTLGEAETAKDGYFQLYGGLAAWHDRCKHEFYAGIPTVTPFGRYRASIGSVTEQINTPIQSTASDLTVLALIAVAKRLHKQVGDKAEVIGFVHDCVLVHAHTNVRDTVREIIKTTMEHPPLDRVGIDSIPIPLIADVKTGRSWAEAV